MKIDDLVGVWTLERFIVHRETGEDFIWPGKQNGTLIYTNSGYVSVAQNRQPLTDGSPEDAARVSNFYTGRYEPDLANGRVFHTALQSSVPEVIGQRMERQVSLDENGRLWLSGVGLKERVTLVWRKVDSEFNQAGSS